MEEDARKIRPKFALTGLELQELKAMAREDELERQVADGPDSPLMAHAEELETAVGQLRIELTDYDTRANVREFLARYLDETVLPGSTDPHLERLPRKLREARRRCWFQLDTKSGKTRAIWDTKAGEPLLCPDDAREEAMRLQRRLTETIGELARKGYRVHYGVLTIENAAPGQLAGRIEKLWRKFRKALKARSPNKPGERVRAKDRPKLFPIVGAIATLECPLSASRTWHPHLNVILITRGFFDWTTWHGHWSAWSKWREIGRKPEQVAAAFRELVKYAVRAVPEKSAAKASSAYGEAPGAAEAENRTPPDPKAPGPAMTEWSRAEWLEWWSCMKGRRRTRTYGELFGLNVEPELDEGEWVTIGDATWSGSRYEARWPLLSSIPGDKSILNIRVRYQKWLAERQHPPDWWAALKEKCAAVIQRADFLEMAP